MFGKTEAEKKGSTDVAAGPPAKSKPKHHADCGETGEVGEVGDLGSNAADASERKEE